MNDSIATRPRGPRASQIHARSFGWPRVLSAVALRTATRRVESPGAAVALVTVVPRSWTVSAYGLAVGAMAALAFVVGSAAMTTGGVWMRAQFFLFTVWQVLVTAYAAQVFSRRWSAWRQWPGRRGDWVLSDVAAAPTGHGHGQRLLDGLARWADAEQRSLLLRVSPDNERALALYRRSGFVATGTTTGKVRMVRRPESS